MVIKIESKKNVFEIIVNEEIEDNINIKELQNYFNELNHNGLKAEDILCYSTYSKISSFNFKVKSIIEWSFILEIIIK